MSGRPVTCRVTTIPLIWPVTAALISELLTYPHRNLAGSVTWNSPLRRIVCADRWPSCQTQLSPERGQISVRTLRPRRRPGSSFLGSAAECAEPNTSKAQSVARPAPYCKKGTGFGPHPCPQIHGTSQSLRGYVRSSEFTKERQPQLEQMLTTDTLMQFLRPGSPIQKSSRLRSSKITLSTKGINPIE